MACVPDAPGTYSGDGATGATACLPGSYAPQAGAASCIPADPGSFVSAPGSSTESACPAGSFAESAGATNCTPASAETFAPAGATHPFPCPAGTQAPAPGAEVCTPEFETLKADNAGRVKLAIGPPAQVC